MQGNNSIALHKLFTRSRVAVADVHIPNTTPVIRGENPALARPRVTLVRDFTVWQYLRITAERNLVNFKPTDNRVTPRSGVGSGNTGVGNAIPRTTPPQNFMLPKIGSRAFTSPGDTSNG